MAADEGLGDTGGNVPVANAARNVPGEEGLAVGIGSQGHDGLGVTLKIIIIIKEEEGLKHKINSRKEKNAACLDHLGGRLAVLVKVAEVASEGEGDDVVTLPETTNLLVLDSGSELERAVSWEKSILD